ncbi:cytochrome c [Aeromicrobium sp.]|uniref:cytochrome bc1 complex diheme cytochrome c subunit n=1 Tax=Aeromicrobium sp. TaxID=1871063 RepID=UPI0028B1E2F6|nr:cytochrome c [Aeromicrobium sp.]
MRKLSTRRRHPMALLALLALALLLTGAAYAAVAPEPATAEASPASEIDAGRQLFVVGCASCHGLNAEGITTAGTDGKAGNYGPSLIGVGAAAVGFQMETGRMPMAQTAPQAPRKANEYTQEEIDQIAAYVASLAPGPARPSDDDLNWQDVDPEGISKGGEFFRTNCTACHNSVGAGGALPSGRYAPTLKNVDAIHIYEAMLTGPQQMPVFSDEVLTPEDKRNIIAYVKTVQQQGNAGGIGGGGLGPVVDGVFAWILGIGGLSLFAVWIGMHGTRSKKR